MKLGGKAAAVIAMAGLSACAGTKSVEVRAIPDPAAALARGDLAAARGQLALGNAGLALEAFRKIQRQRPTDPAPLAGMADCYASMGRLDLAQFNYEAALALAPRDRTLLLGLAAIYDRQGAHGRALATRAEADANVASTAAVGSLTVALPPVRPTDRMADLAVRADPPVVPISEEEPDIALPSAAAVGSLTVALPPVHAADHMVEAAVRADPPVVTLAEESASAETDLGLPSAVALASLTLDLPPAGATDRMADVAIRAEPPAIAMAELASKVATPVPVPPAPKRPALHETVMALAPRPLAPTPKPEPEPELAVALPPSRPASTRLPMELSTLTLADARSGPRLERLSLGEVALVTIPSEAPAKPKPTVLTAQNSVSWVPLREANAKPKSAVRMAQNSVRWIPLREAMARPNVRVLNAARSQGLAASARTVLLSRGWRKIAIADATEIRRKSVVLYPKERAKLGRSLAAQFGVEARLANNSPLLLVLGQDAVSARAKRRS